MWEVGLTSGWHLFPVYIPVSPEIEILLQNKSESWECSFAGNSTFGLSKGANILLALLYFWSYAFITGN